MRDIIVLILGLVYVQWTRTAKALGCVLESMGIEFLYYNRMANQKQKTRALDEFTNKTDIKILVSTHSLSRVSERSDSHVGVVNEVRWAVLESPDGQPSHHP